MSKIKWFSAYQLIIIGIIIAYSTSCFHNSETVNSIKWHEFSWDSTATGLVYYISTTGRGDKISDTESVNLRYIWFDYTSENKKFVGAMNGRMNEGVIPGFRQAVFCLKNKGAGYFKIPRKLYNNAPYANNEDFLLYYVQIIDCPYRINR